MLRQASRSCKSSKEMLLKSLTDMKVDNSANRICGIVLKAKKIVEPTMSTTSLKCSYGNINLKTNALIFQLKSLIVGEEPGCNVAEKIIKRLDEIVQWYCRWPELDLSDKAESVLKLLREVNNSETLNLKYKNPEEYVMHLITTTNNLVSSLGDGSRYPTDSSRRYRENIFEVQRSLLKSASYKVEDLLCSIFQIGRARSDFSEVEKREIGTLMITALQPIKTNMKSISFFPGCKLSSLLQRRSALQFLLEDYTIFPVGNGALLKEFIEGKMNASIEYIDNMITVWSLIIDYLGEGEVDEEEGNWLLSSHMIRWYEEENDLMEAGASEVPKSHTWWADSIKKCITEASRSCKPLKGQLVKKLMDIRVDRNACRVCGLILKAKKIIGRTTNASSLKYYGDINLRTDIITYELKNLIAGDKPEFISAKKLVKQLKDPFKSTKNIPDKSVGVLQLLLEIDNSESLNLKYTNSEEYLKCLISEFTGQRNLHFIQSSIAFFASYGCEELLLTIFQISRARSDFSDEEKRKIGTLLVEALHPIEIRHNDIRCFEFYKLSTLLQIRSALQFLLDDYATFPTGNGALLKDFYENKINVSIRNIENLIREWCDNFGELLLDEGEPSDYILVNEWDNCILEDISCYEGAGAFEVPDSHNWWADSIKKYISASKEITRVPEGPVQYLYGFTTTTKYLANILGTDLFCIVNKKEK